VNRYALAPMSTSLAVLTWLLLTVPVLLLLAAARQPAPVAHALYAVTALMVLIYAWVALWWRPTGFELTGRELVIHWPVRRRAFSLDQVTAVEVVDFDALHARYGRGMRVGAGGLWGAFGLYVMKRLTVLMYVSRWDQLVLLSGLPRPLLISPEEHEAFVLRLSQRS